MTYPATRTYWLEPTDQVAVGLRRYHSSDSPGWNCADGYHSTLAVTFAVRWLETRTGHGLFPRLARKLARWLMLGLGDGKPVYVHPGDVVRVGHAGAVHRR